MVEQGVITPLTITLIRHPEAQAQPVEMEAVMGVNLRRTAQVPVPLLVSTGKMGNMVKVDIVDIICTPIF